MARCKKRQMKKRRIIVIVSIILALILLFPVPIRYKDGGSVKFHSVVNIYSVTKLHRLRPIEDGGGFEDGFEIRVFGYKVFQYTKTKRPMSQDEVKGLIAIGLS